MGAHFIALNRKTSLSPEECFSLYKDGLYNNKLFHMVLGNADSYLDEKKLPGRKKWSEESVISAATRDALNWQSICAVWTTWSLT